MRPCGISDNAVQPSGELRPTLELAEIAESKEKSLLHGIFGIFKITQDLPCSAEKARHTGNEEVAQFGVIHMDGESWRPLDLQTGRTALFRQQVTSLVVRLKHSLATAIRMQGCFQ